MEPYLGRTFLERLAHDLRGATSIGAGALDELAEQLRGTDAEPLSQIARRSLARVLRISTSLSEAAELERGGVTLSSADADLLETARAAVEGARALENRRGRRLSRDLTQVGIHDNLHFVPSDVARGHCTRSGECDGASGMAEAAGGIVV